MPSYLFNTINLIHLIIEFIDKIFGIIPNNKPITSPILPPHRIIHTTHAPPPKLPSQIIKNKKFYSPPQLPIPIITRTNLKNQPLPILPPKRIIEQKSIQIKNISIPKRILPIPMTNITKNVKYKSPIDIIPYINKINIIPKKSLSQTINPISYTKKSNSSNNNSTTNNNSKTVNNSKSVNLSQIAINPNVPLSQSLTQDRKIIASKPKSHSTSSNNTTKNNRQQSNFDFSKIKLLPKISLSNVIHNRKIITIR